MNKWEKLYRQVKDLEDKYYERASKYTYKVSENSSYMYNLAKATAFQLVRYMMEDLEDEKNENQRIC
jgi:hypothetical protein